MKIHPPPGRDAWIGRLLALVCLFATAAVFAQTKPIEGIRENTPQVHALVNARIVQAPGKVIEKGTIVLRDGVIEAVGADVSPPPDARIWDGQGLTVYPGLIEPYSHLGLPKESRRQGQGQGQARPPQNQQPKQGVHHWNPRVHPEVNTAELYQVVEKDIAKLRNLGFTAALVVPRNGIFRGTSTLVSLREGDPNEAVIRAGVAQHLAFERGGFRDRTYPGSLMGAIALIRQTLYDAQWYQQAHAAYDLNPRGQERPEVNEALEALVPVVQGKQLVVIETADEQALLRAAKIAKEFGLKLYARGSGYEYRLLQTIKDTGIPVLLPFNFPEDPSVDTPEEALEVSLEELQHWEAAPENPRRLQEAGIPFALTTSTLKDPSRFRAQIRKAVERGLPADAALAAMTTVPARLLGVEKQLGTIEAGKLGHLVVTDGDLFAEKTKVLDVWVDGQRVEVEKKPEVDPRGKWQLTIDLPDGRSLAAELELKGEVNKLSGTLSSEQARVKVDRAVLEHRRLALSFPGDSLGIAGVVRMSGGVEPQRISGTGELPDGRPFRWRTEGREPLAAEKPEPKPSPPAAAEAPRPLAYPPGAFGRMTPPEQPMQILVRGATLWTSGPEGRLLNADMLVSDGKIVQIAPNLKAPDAALIIDARGKHVTPGLIDAHSHTAVTGGVNEGTQAVSAEVRIGDVLDATDIAIYRELAGGLTVANVLHGSANPIGGQNAVIKLRWGQPFEELKFEGAPPGIKFALGENVKQSNWGDQFTTRYPQTRMGVEQIIRDRFQAALDYEKEWQAYRARKNKKGVLPPRRDLELDALLEILRGKRLVHSHSYRQDEILMLTRIAEDFGFRIATFQHVLEGYKVAEALARHGAGASTFSDWWAYKFEVYDAIPYNGALMHDAGVVVSFNSDSDELARRLNTEAAKAVKYGGLSEEEALKLVTINPAQQLRIDDRVGSLEPGKDADFVIWSDHPLSTLSVCEQTWVDGRKYFDRTEDLEMRRKVEAERARLIQKVLRSKKKNDRAGRPGARPTDDKARVHAEESLP